MPYELQELVRRNAKSNSPEYTTVPPVPPTPLPPPPPQKKKEEEEEEKVRQDTQGRYGVQRGWTYPETEMLETASSVKWRAASQTSVQIQKGCGRHPPGGRESVWVRLILRRKFLAALPPTSY